MPGLPLISRVPNHFVKTVTFDGSAFGDQSATPDTIATVTGRVLITHLSAYCTTLLAGASATIELGVAGNTAELIAQTTATDLDADEVWRSATPDVGAGPPITDYIVGKDIILTVGTADVTAGVLEISFLWLPMSLDGNVT